MILPAHAADCHMHVFGPYERYPLAAERAYNVAEAPIEAHERMERRVGLERTVLVQASGYGFDNRAMLAALEALGPRGRAVAVLHRSTEQEELQRLHALGVRGVRLNLVTLGARHPGDRVETIDHMGLPDATAGIAQPGFQAVLRLARARHVWVKLAGADRITRVSGRLRDAIPFMQSLAAIAPERLVWGSDWPHIGFHSRRQIHSDALLPFRDIDTAELLEVLCEALPDGAARRAILAENPARLYGF